MNRDALILLAILGAIGLTVGGVMVTTRKWPGEAPAKYKNHITAAEIREGLPHDLLARLLWQESRFRDDIISGAVVSPAGAMGIAQIVPRWHPGVDPLDPFASIDYAARYLRDLRLQTGSWPLALAAYNWGIGNLNRALNNFGSQNALLSAPKETRNYVADITGDLPGLV
jgi:soluble lytic murein transglycosylase-like protein